MIPSQPNVKHLYNSGFAQHKSEELHSARASKRYEVLICGESDEQGWFVLQRRIFNKNSRLVSP